MLNKFLFVLKKIVLAVFLIYSYNKLALPLDVLIPMNVITIVLVSFCGIPSIIMLILFSIYFI